MQLIEILDHIGNSRAFLRGRSVELVGPFGWIKRFAIEVLGHVLKTHGIAAQLLDASQKSWIRRSLFIAGDRAADTGLTLHPTRPAECHIHLLTVALHIHGDLLQQHAYDLLPIWRGSLGRRPPARQVWS